MFDFTEIDTIENLSCSKDIFPRLIERQALCVLPARGDEKRPSIAGWKEYTKRLPTSEEYQKWTSPARVCIVCGKVSGNLECLDFDCAGIAFEPWKSKIRGSIFKKLFIERTPSGGYHIWYRLDGMNVSGNRKIAKGEDGKALIETRGEGGLALCYPSPGYPIIQGSWEELPFLTPAEYQEVMEAAKSFDVPEPVPTPITPTVSTFSGTSGENLIERIQREISIHDEISWLESMGWKSCGQQGDYLYFTRPGKSIGVSASLICCGEMPRFKVFTTSDPIFDASREGEGYSPFDVFARWKFQSPRPDNVSAIREFIRGWEEDHGENFTEEELPDFTELVDSLQKKTEIPISVAEPQEEELPDFTEEAELTFSDSVESLDEKFFDCPGFLNDAQKIQMENAYTVQKEFFFSAALMLLSTLTAQLWKTQRGTRGNLYHVNVGRSGCGKDYPRQFIMQCFEENNLRNCISEKYLSDSGIQNDLRCNRIKIWLWDEMGLAQQNLSTGSTHEKRVFEMLLTLYNKAAGTLYPAVKASIGAKTKEECFDPIPFPYFNLLGSSTPNEWFGSLKKWYISSGMYSRIMPFYAGKNVFKPFSQLETEIPPEFQSTVSIMIGWLAQRLQEEDFQGNVVPESPGVITLLDNFKMETEEFSEKLSDADAGIWSRAPFMADKYALLRAVSRDWTQPEITETDMNWAIQLTRVLTARKVLTAKENRPADEDDCIPFADSMEKVEKYIHRKKNGVTRQQLSNNFRKLRAKDRKEILDTLIESKRIFQENGKFYSRLSKES